MDGLDIQRAFIELVRLGIGTETESVPNLTFGRVLSRLGETRTSSVPLSLLQDFNVPIDWNALEDLAARQGLYAVLVDGVGKLPENMRPPKPVLLQWIGETLQGYEYRYEQYRKAIAGLAAFYNKHGFRMMLLKGYACSLDWPRPDHRPCGDIDIWLFGQQKEADAALAARFKKFERFRIDNSHHHHSIFYWQDFMVENHYDFISTLHHRSHIAYERILKELGKDDSYSIELYGEKVYLPSPDLHALFLLKHAMLHFVGTELTFRQVLDWAFFVKRHSKEVDWEMVVGVLEEHGMMPMFNILNAICVDDLGFDPSLFPMIKFDPVVKARVLKEIFACVYQDDRLEGFLTRQVNRYRRWRDNGWKHDLCYKESRWSAFMMGIWGHILKPASI